MAINKEQIIETAEALTLEGVSPTMALIRERLGGGSFATISPVLREWKEKQQAEASPEAPPQALELGRRVAVMVWQEAEKQARQQVEGIERRTAELLQEAKAETVEVIGEVRRLEREASELRQQLQAKAEALANVEQTVAILQTKLEDSTTRVEELKQQVEKSDKETKEARDQAAELRGKLSALVPASPPAPATPTKKKTPKAPQ